MKVKLVTAKLGTMRKPQEFIVYPGGTADSIKMQSDSRICAFDPSTGKGMLSKSGRPYFIDLSTFRGATPVAVPPEVIAMALEAIPKPGDEIGSGVYVGGGV